MNGKQVAYRLRAHVKRPFSQTRNQLLGAEVGAFNGLDKNGERLGVRWHLGFTTHLDSPLFLPIANLVFGGEVDKTPLTPLAPQLGIIAEQRKKRSRLNAQKFSHFSGAKPSCSGRSVRG